PVQAGAGFVEQARKGKYQQLVRTKPAAGAGAYHGIVLVPSVVERTPPYIETILPGSPAARAGLRPDDLIVFVDGEPIASVKAFLDLIARSQPGTVLRLEVRRLDRTVADSAQLV